MSDERIVSAWSAFLETTANSDCTAALAAAGRIVQIAPDEMLIHQQDDDQSIFLVCEGTLKAVWYTPNGHEIWLSDLSPGAIVGELSALTSQPRSSCVLAKTNALLVETPQPTFTALMGVHPEIGAAIANRLAERLVVTSRQLRDLVGLPLSARLHHELCRLGETNAEDIERVELKDPPAIGHLATLVHASREATSRAFSHLLRRGLVIRRADGTLTMISP